MLFPRRILKSLKLSLKLKEIVVLTGMRRTGKTTLLKMLFNEIKSDNKIFLDLENIIEQKIFEEEDYNNILNNLSSLGLDDKEKSYIFIDEIQLKPDIVKPIKYLYDHCNIKFFLTGSSSFYLKNLFPESLAGRKIMYELFPLDFQEFLVFKEIEKEFYESFDEKLKRKNKIRFEKYVKHFEEYIRYGGFPQIALAKKEPDKKLILKDIFNSYFEKDIRTLADFKNINKFRDLLFLLLERAGAKLDIAKLSREIEISRDSVYSYLNFLEGTYFINLISPFSRNVDKEVSGTKKVYICDTGILNNFSKVSEGCLFENSVFINLRKYDKMNYYQRRSGAEIDFLFSNKKIAFEVKNTAHEYDIKKLSSLAEQLNLKKSYVITRKFSEGKNMILAQDI